MAGGATKAAAGRLSAHSASIPPRGQDRQGGGPAIRRVGQRPVAERCRHGCRRRGDFQDRHARACRLLPDGPEAPVVCRKLAFDEPGRPGGGEVASRDRPDDEPAGMRRRQNGPYPRLKSCHALSFLAAPAGIRCGNSPQSVDLHRVTRHQVRARAEAIAVAPPTAADRVRRRSHSDAGSAAALAIEVRHHGDPPPGRAHKPTVYS